MGIQIFIMMSSERGALRKIMLGFPQKQTQSTSFSSALCKVSGLVQSSRNQSRVLGLGGARKSSSCLTAAGLPRLVSRPAALPLVWGAGSASFSRVSRPSARSCCTSPY